MTSEHGFRDHSASDLIDWAEYRKHQEADEDADEDADEEYFSPEMADMADVDWNYWAD